MSTQLYIYGAGGLAAEVRMWVERAGLLVDGRFEFGGYVVGEPAHIQDSDPSLEIAGYEDWLIRRRDKRAVVLGFSDPRSRWQVGQRMLDAGIELPVVIDPSGVYDKESCRFGPGVLVAAGCVLTTNITLRKFALLNLGSTVGHGAVIGKGSVVNPGAHISGDVNIGSGVLVGTGATILEKRTLGDFSVVGGGALVHRDVEPGDTVGGVPAHILLSRPEGTA